MTIDAYIDNPVINNQREYYELLERLEEIDPKCQNVQLRTDRLIIENIVCRTFRYSLNPSIEWVAGRLRYMVENGL